MPSVNPGPDELIRLHRRRAVAHFLSDETQGLIDSVNFRMSMLLEVWSKYRSREPFLKTLETRFHDIPAAELLVLEPSTLNLVNRFYRHLTDLVLYLQFTEDMVLTLEDSFKGHFRKMMEVHELLAPRLLEEISRAEEDLKKAGIQPE